MFHRYNDSLLVGPGKGQKNNILILRCLIINWITISQPKIMGQKPQSKVGFQR